MAVLRETMDAEGVKGWLFRKGGIGEFSGVLAILEGAQSGYTINYGIADDVDLQVLISDKISLANIKPNRACVAE